MTVESDVAARPTSWPQVWDVFRELRRADDRRSHYLFSRVTLDIWRAGQCLRYARGARCWVVRRMVLVADLVWTQALMGAELPHEAWAGPGLKLEHGGRGVILHPSVSLGRDVTIYHRVTIGVKDGRPAASVGDRVYLGAGCVILGPVVLGEGCRIGANAVVTNDTEPHRTYAGTPARPVGTPRVHDL
ncbi:DapH/DapD/GlmU-related protein [Agilicoccus flavus]|uniref:DapH/DapD/GlmU-related protein n=1 Tax=Agilicoccus flavus TaxID=2775968 RepID=UPI001CF6A478|nr:DapH/DapD/GlmU-related protein [Agilicoccus flavus]